MFYKISLNEDIELVSGKFIKNGYTARKAKRKKAKGSGFDYGIEITGDGKVEEAEDDE